MAFESNRSVPPESVDKAVIYARYSSDKQTENSIDFQLRAAHTYCAAKQLEVIDEYIDRAVSGTSDQRPEFQRMIRDAHNQRFAYVIVYRFDRFARNRYDSAIYKKELERNGIHVLSTEESVGNGDEGMILESIYEAMAESYSKRLSRVVARGMQETARKGLSTGGNLPYGYRVEDHKVVPDETIAPIIRQCFEERNAGTRKQAIADHLNASGHRTKTGKSFTVGTVTRILTNPIYKGIHNYAGIERSSPAIVSAELWDSVQRIESQDKRLYGQKAEKNEYLLTGRLFCGLCGATMSGEYSTGASGRTYAYYACSANRKHCGCTKKRENKEVLEQYVCRQILSGLQDETIRRLADGICTIANGDRDSAATERAELERRLTQTERELESAANALMKTDSPALIRHINEQATALEHRETLLRAALERLQDERPPNITKQDAEGFLRNLQHSDITNPNVQKQLIRTFVNCIYLFEDQILLYTAYGNTVEYSDMQNDRTHIDTPCLNSLADAPPTKSRTTT